MAQQQETASLLSATETRVEKSFKGVKGYNTKTKLVNRKEQDKTVNQSKQKDLVTCSWLKAGENEYEWVTIGWVFLLTAWKIGASFFL